MTTILCTIAVVYCSPSPFLHCVNTLSNTTVEGVLIAEGDLNYVGDFSKEANLKNYIGDYSKVLVSKSNCVKIVKKQLK
jgi:hypothetical protein